MPNSGSKKQRDYSAEAAESLRRFVKQDFPNLEIVEATWNDIELVIDIGQRTEFCYWDSLAFFGIRKKRGKNKWLHLINITRGGDAGNRAIILCCQETERRPRSDGPEITYIQMFKRNSYQLTSEIEVTAFVEKIKETLQGG